MKAREIRRTALVAVAAMMISSALMAAPNAHSNNCPAPGTDTATWGGNGNGPLRSSTSPCATLSSGSGVSVYTNQTQSEQGHGLAYAFGKMLSGLRSSIEGTVWGGGGQPPR